MRSAVGVDRVINVIIYLRAYLFIIFLGAN